MRRTRWPLILMTLAVMTLPAGLLAQNVKVGIIDMERAIVGSVEGKKAEATFTAKLEALRKSIETKQKDLETQQTKLRTQDKLLDEALKANMTRDIEQRQTELTRAQEDAQKELDTLRTELMRPIAEVAETIVEKYAKEQDYTLIIDTSNPQNGSIVWVNPKDEITETITKLIDAEMAKNPPKKP
jgi:outer membrane protein